MKKIIRFLARVSGVEDEIRQSQTKEIGGRMWQDAYWWNGGSNAPLWDVFNAFFLYANSLKRGSIADIDYVRKKVYRMAKLDEIIDPNNDFKE